VREISCWGFRQRPVTTTLRLIPIGSQRGRQPTVAPSPIPAEVIITNRPSMSSGR
jgi:hypothetical protein